MRGEAMFIDGLSSDELPVLSDSGSERQQAVATVVDTGGVAVLMQ